MPTTPHAAAGMRIEPPPSVPSATGQSPASNEGITIGSWRRHNCSVFLQGIKKLIIIIIIVIIITIVNINKEVMKIIFERLKIRILRKPLSRQESFEVQTTHTAHTTDGLIDGVPHGYGTHIRTDFEARKYIHCSYAKRHPNVSLMLWCRRD